MTMAEKLQATKTDTAPLRAVKGMNDILPPESAQWEWVEDTVRRLMLRYGAGSVLVACSFSAMVMSARLRR